MKIHTERNTIFKRQRLYGQLLKFHAQGNHQTVRLWQSKENLDLVINSDLLLRRVDLSADRMQSFSVRHKLQREGFPL